MYAAIRDPQMSPSVVAISRDMPIFIFDNQSFMYLLAARWRSQVLIGSGLNSLLRFCKVV